MNAAPDDGWGASHARHRTLHRGRSMTPGRDPTPAPIGTALAPSDGDRDDRSVRQRLSDAMPMTLVAAICFGLGLTLRANGTNGPAPALPFWTLFLALGCIAALGAGASWVVGGSASPASEASATLAPRGVRPRRQGDRPVEDPAPQPDAFADPLGDPRDDLLPAVGWEPARPPREPATAGRVRTALPSEDPMPEFPSEGTVGRATSSQVIEEIDRLVSDLKPSAPRPRPTT